MKFPKKLMIGSLSLLLSATTFAGEEAPEKGREPGKKGPRAERKGGPEMRAKILKKFDKDGDGKLSEEERKAARESFEKHRGELHAKLLEKFDKDGDGKLSEEERKAAREAFKKRHEERGAKLMETFDKDGSGELNLEEVQALLKALRERRGDQGKGPEGRPKGKRPVRRGPNGNNGEKGPEAK